MQKRILNIDEAAEYSGYQKSYLYQLTHQKKIPFSKPLGRVFFDRLELDKFLLGNPCNMVTENKNLVAAQ